MTTHRRSRAAVLLGGLLVLGLAAWLLCGHRDDHGDLAEVTVRASTDLEAPWGMEAPGWMQPIFSAPFAAEQATSQDTAGTPRNWIRCVDHLSGAPVVGVPVQVAVDGLSSEAGPVVGRTDQDGILEVSEQGAALVLRSPDHAPRCAPRDEASSHDAPQVIALHRGVRLSGQLLDPTGVPVPGLRLSASRTRYLLPAEATAVGLIGKRFVVRTDADGRFAFDGLLDGADYTLRSLESGWIPSGTTQRWQRDWTIQASREQPERVLEVARAYAWAITRRKGTPRQGIAWLDDRIDLPVWLRAAWSGSQEAPGYEIARQVRALADARELEIVRSGVAAHVGGPPWPERGQVHYTERTRGHADESMQLWLHGEELRVAVPVVRADLLTGDDLLALPIVHGDDRKTRVRFRFHGLRGDEAPAPEVAVQAVDRPGPAALIQTVRPSPGWDSLHLAAGRYRARVAGHQGWMDHAVSMSPIEFEVAHHEITVPLHFDVPVHVVACTFEDENGLPVLGRRLMTLPASSISGFMQDGEVPLIQLDGNTREFRAALGGVFAGAVGTRFLQADLPEVGMHRLTFRLPADVAPNAPALRPHRHEFEPSRVR